MGISMAYTIGAGNPIAIDYTLPAQLISFLVLVWILKKYAWGPLINMMEKRRQFIEDNLANAEQERKEAEKIRKEYQEEMRQARQEAQVLIDKAIKLSEERSVEILAQARQEAEKTKKSALSDIERERDKAIIEVKAEVAEMSIAIAEKIIQQKLDFKGQEALIDQFIQEVGDRPC
ncbi:MAG: F0F1 ATP synthase subunit B [Eubacteriales bacterium]